MLVVLSLLLSTAGPALALSRTSRSASSQSTLTKAVPGTALDRAAGGLPAFLSQASQARPASLPIVLKSHSPAASPPLPAGQQQPPHAVRLCVPAVFRDYAPLERPRPVTVTVTPEAGGQLVAMDGQVVLDVPPGAVDVPAVIAHTPWEDVTSLPAGALSERLAFHFTAQDPTLGAQSSAFILHPSSFFNVPARLTLRYEQADVDGKKDEARLVVRTRSGPGQPWASLPTQVDTEHNLVTAYTTHFSQLALAASPPLSAPLTFELAPLIPPAPAPGGVFFTNMLVVTRDVAGGPLMLSSTPDGLGELSTGDAVAISVRGPSGVPYVYSHVYTSGTLTSTTPAIDVSDWFEVGRNTVHITLTKLGPGQAWTFGYLLVSPRNPYARHLGGNYPIALAEHTIDLVSGNFLWQTIDLPVRDFGPRVAFQRTYNSRDESAGVFGPGWSSPYDSRLWVALDGSVEVRRADGQRELFAGDCAGYRPEPGVFDSLACTAGGWTLTEFRTQTAYTYDASGQLVEIADAYGNPVEIVYGEGYIRVSGASGRTYTLTLSDGRVSGLAGPAEA